MIDLRDRPDVGWNVLLVCSLFAIGVSIWYGFLLPVQIPTKAPEGALRLVYSTARRSSEKASEARTEILAKTWDDKIDTLGSRTMEMLTTLSEKHNLQLSGFRTDKASQVASLTELPSVVTVEGSFPDTMAFISELEQKNSKLAVQMMQVTASDNTPGSVTATLALAGYVFKEDE